MINEKQDIKVFEFTQAMEKYLSHWFYQKFEILVAMLIIILQLITLTHLIYTYQPISYFALFGSLVTAYLFTDFMNGLVHMIMDNNTNYTSFFGPYVAAFHIHHYKDTHQKRHPLKVYFFESRTKFWLLIYLSILTVLQFRYPLPSFLHVVLVAFGFFSSLAEVSHYWCHARIVNPGIQFLQKYRILLSKEHHRAHHCDDNKQYAFLNGMTDPLLNVISWCFFKGYKNHADKHTRHYMKQQL